MNIIQIFKKWSLLCAIAVGMSIYCLFYYTPILVPVGEICGPALQGLMPWILFTILYVTFCKIEVKEMRPRTWHIVPVKAWEGGRSRRK